MHEPRMQRTLCGPVSLEGVGYWSGESVRVEFWPGRPDSGIVFVRSDLGRQARVPADCFRRVDVPRRTNLRFGQAGVDMIEHILAALSGMQITNCEVWMNRPEAPGMDGSASAFVEAIELAGSVEQDKPVRVLSLNETVRIEQGQSWVEASPHPDGAFSVEYRLAYPEGSGLAPQSYCAEVRPEIFRSEIAPARTFLLESEAEQLKAQGLGGHVKTSDLLVLGGDGPIGNTLRFENECARHKTLDVIGDLALAGVDLRARVVACRSGHRLNAELARELRRRADDAVDTREAA